AILLADLWDAARARNYARPTFDADLYHEFRARGLKLDDFLGRQLGVLHGKLPEAVDSGLALDLLAHHTTPLGTAEQRTLAELEQTYGHRQDVLPALVQECRDLYLLVDPSRNQPDQPPASRLTHDTLAPHVRKRFDESVAPGQQARRILESRAVEWRNDQSGPVLDGPDLAAVEAGRSGMRAWEEEKGEIRLFQASQLARRKRLRQRWVTFGTLASLALAVVLALSWDTLQDWRLQQEVIKASLQVDVGAFKLDRYEVSIALYAKCFRSDSQRCPKPESNEDFSRYSDGDKQLGDLPVTDVTAIQARAFCQWLGRRLPTYEEWIIAVRRWESEVIQVDDTLAISDQYNMGQSRSSLWPVNRVTADTQDGALRPLHLIGNAWEWTTTDTENRQWDGRSSNLELQRAGGGFISYMRDLSDSYPSFPHDVSPETGIRCAKDSPQ
ncbi:MAG: SUMF1/EgtB/PvdO family nonheme iron enzyme, partial [Anaerolineae bacterium]